MKGSGHGPNAAGLRDAPRAEEQHEFYNYRKSRRRRSSLEPMSKKPALGLGVSDPLAAFRFYSNWHRACYRGGRSAISAPARPRTAANVEHAALGGGSRLGSRDDHIDLRTGSRLVVEQFAGQLAREFHAHAS